MSIRKQLQAARKPNSKQAVSALKRANLLFLVGFDKGGVVDDDDGGE
jgi:hypothetical protein